MSEIEISQCERVGEELDQLGNLDEDLPVLVRGEDGGFYPAALAFCPRAWVYVICTADEAESMVNEVELDWGYSTGC